MAKQKILLVCPMQDAQSGIYIHDSLIHLGHKVAYFDHRDIASKMGFENMNKTLVDASKQLDPDVILIIKGVEIAPQTIDEIKKVTKAKIIGWIFDVTLGGSCVKDCPQYVELLKKFDKFYTIDADAVPELTTQGVNADWLSEGCYPNLHKEQVINKIQERKYGSDIVFLGSIGTIHPNRSAILERLHKEGFNYTIYGDCYFKDGEEPEWSKVHHAKDSQGNYLEAVNDVHAIVCQSSKVVLGIDGWPDRKYSWSARLYRTLCPGAFLLTTHTKGIEDFFIPGKHLDTFKNEDELVEKLLYWLNEDDKRKDVAKAGQELVMSKHQFMHRLKRMLDE